MAVKTIEYPSQPLTDLARNHSRTIWGDCPWDQIVNGEKDGTAFYDDFNAMPFPPVETAPVGYGQYGVVAAAGLISPVGVVNSVPQGGTILQVVQSGGAAGNCMSLWQPAPCWFHSGLTSNTAKLWFECRVAINTLLASHGKFFVGFGETNAISFGAAVPFTSSTGLAISASGSMVGWISQMLQTIAGQVNGVYSDRATTFTYAGNAALSDGPGFSGPFVFAKLGMVYNPSDKDGKAVRFFQDGVYTGTSISATQLAATTNLKANPLGLMASFVAGSAMAVTDAFYMDWWRVAQLFSVGGD